MSIIKIQNLDFTYPEEKEKALAHICIEIEEGQFVTLCGQSGSGKSTLLRHLKLALRPEGTRSGEIFYQGKAMEEYSKREMAADIGYVSQSVDNQLVTDKVWHELAFAMENLGMENALIRQRVSEMAMFFGIQSWFHQDIRELSGGQKQILSLASLMTLLPKVILLDEPTSQLDPIAASEFMHMLEKINKELGTTIILAEHHLEEVLPISDQVIVMERGQVLVNGTPLEVCRELKRMQHPMVEALPVPVKMWSHTGDDETCPMNVNEGRQWLSHFCKKRGIAQEACKDRNDVIEEMKDREETGDVIADSKDVVSHHGRKKNMDSQRPKALTGKNLWYRYDSREKDVICHTNITVYEGEILCILGGNGTGKSTLLSLLAGLRKPQGGRVEQYGKRIGMLPQNPKSLFIKKTVAEELSCSQWDNDHFGEETVFSTKEEIIGFCKLNPLFNRHPYDLSGGEQQRLALAKVLMRNPEILLLDEPTKGFDNSYKQEVIRMLKTLKKCGKTIVIVSHDVEFCAEVADRCALFFDGDIVSENVPKAFFAGNHFYTTAANRISRGILEGIVILQDFLDYMKVEHAASDADEAENQNEPENQNEIDNRNETDNEIENKSENENENKIEDKSECENENEQQDSENTNQHQKQVQVMAAELSATKEKVKAGYTFAMMMVLLAIPLTLYVGVTFLGDQKYLFIALVVLLECMAPFVLRFEGRNPQARELVLISVICALCIAGRGLFYWLPEFKPVVALVVIAGAVLGAETGFLVGAVTMLVSNVLFGQGPWTPWQMFALGFIGFLSGIVFYERKIGKNPLCLAVFGAVVAVVIYGGIMNLAAALMSHATMNVETILAFYVTGLPIDMIRGAATFLFTILLAKPVIKKMDRTIKKYGLFS